MKTKSLTYISNTILTAAFLLFSTAEAAFASTPLKAPKFSDVVSEFSAHCQPECVRPFRVEAQDLLTSLMETSLKEKFAKIAFQQSQIWADTILEGDYYADGENHLESVEALYKNDVLIGYRIFYYEKAWDTATCSFDPETRQGLENCVPGIIREASFVSPSLRSVINDENNYATFIPKHF